MVAKNVLRDPAIPPEAKGLYAYLAGFAGDSDECFPGISLISGEMAMSKNRLYKYMNILISVGVVERKQTYNGNIKGKVIYKITDCDYDLNSRIPGNAEIGKQQDSVSANLGIRDMGNPQDEETNNNSIKNNSLNNNSINYQLIADMYNKTCVSFPKLTKLSDMRKKAIKARLKHYSVDDFERLFQMAEESSFLKGQNNRNWSATFDWLIKDANMAKVLDGNYADKPGQQPQEGYDISEEDKRYDEYLSRILPDDYEPSPDDPFQ